MRMLLDGRPQRAFAAVGRPFFGPGSRHLVYQAKLADGWALVLDEEVGTLRVDGFLKGVPVLFDSPRSLHALALRRAGPEFLRLEINLDPVQNRAEQQQRDAVDAENGSDRQRLATLSGQVMDVEGNQEKGQITEQKDQPGGSR